MSMTKITIPRPDDWHLHLRDGAMLEGVIAHSAKDFGRAIIMPNLVPPVVTTADAKAYHQRIMAALPDGMSFEPLMTLYLTEATDPADVEAGFKSGLVTALKLYPAGATTNSQSGVTNFENVIPVLQKMAEIGISLTGKLCLSKPCLIRLENAFRNCALSWNMSRPNRALNMPAPVAPILVRRSPPITSSSTAMRFWQAAFARIIIACPLQSAKSIALHFGKQPHPAIRPFSLGQIQHRILIHSSFKNVVALAFSHQSTPCHVLRMYLKKMAHSTSSKPSPRAMARRFTECQCMKRL